MVIQIYDETNDEMIGFICSLNSKIGIENGTLYSYLSYECYEIMRYKELILNAKEYFIKRVKYFIKEIEIVENTDCCYINVII